MKQYVFQPTPFLRRATRDERGGVSGVAVSTHALLAKGDEDRLDTLADIAAVSTHALLAKGDHLFFDATSSSIVSTHALLAKGDLTQPTPRHYLLLFQPTPFLRRATMPDRYYKARCVFQPTPFLRRATSDFTKIHSFKQYKQLKYSSNKRHKQAREA